jgi:hypothetical protein
LSQATLNCLPLQIFTWTSQNHEPMFGMLTKLQLNLQEEFARKNNEICQRQNLVSLTRRAVLYHDHTPASAFQPSSAVWGQPPYRGI